MISYDRIAELWDAHLTMSHEDRLQDHLPLIRAVEAEARKRALEEAAAICENTLLNKPAYITRDDEWTLGYSYGAGNCHARIRALAEG